MILYREEMWVACDGPPQTRRYGLAFCMVEMEVKGRRVWTITVEGEYELRIPPDTLIADYLGLEEESLYFSSENQAAEWLVRLARPRNPKGLTAEQRRLSAMIRHPWKLSPEALEKLYHRVMRKNHPLGQDAAKRRAGAPHLRLVHPAKGDAL